MRLLKVDPGSSSSDSLKLELKEFMGNRIPPYAILSHTWGEDEVLYSDVQSRTYEGKEGYTKLKYAYEQARVDGYGYLWADTCCIDKSSSAELSESINSMYSWYAKAELCYVYLADVYPALENLDATAQFGAAKWWTRGWTLQELIAPKRLTFYSADWSPIGTEIELELEIARITQIDTSYLDLSLPLESASIAKRMSWAARRQTTREEDIAYCLLGIFDVNMPLLYGEGKKAFLRLQEEIMRQSYDHSIFAWTSDLSMDFHGLLADGPEALRKSADVIPDTSMQRARPYGMTNRGLEIEFVILPKNDDICEATLECIRGDSRHQPGSIFLKRIPGSADQHARTFCHSLFWRECHGSAKTVFVLQRLPISLSRHASSRVPLSVRTISENGALDTYRLVQGHHLVAETPSLRDIIELNSRETSNSSRKPIPVRTGPNLPRSELFVCLRKKGSNLLPRPDLFIFFGHTSEGEYGFKASKGFPNIVLRTVPKDFHPIPMGTEGFLSPRLIKVTAELGELDYQPVYHLDITITNVESSTKRFSSSLRS